MSNWRELTSLSEDNHPFMECVDSGGEVYLTIEKNGTLDLELATNVVDADTNEYMFYNIRIPQSVVQALLVAYSRRMDK